VFRVVDDRPGSHAAVTLARPGPLRVYAHVRATADAADLTGLRVLLVADLLTRAAEVRGLQVFSTRAFTGEPAGKAVVEGAAAALGVYPPVLPAAAPATGRPGGPSDVHVAADDAAGADGLGGILLRTAPARLAQDARAVSAGSAGSAVTGMPGGHDPLAVRLALMSVPRRQPAELTADDLAGAAHTLGEWRYRVARWAESPSGAIPKSAAATFQLAFSDLDIGAVLALLSGLAADEAVPPGPRFETFVYADRVLGLALPRDIGR
jgi:hypothetical protein